ncbi:MAG: hypothetical protein ABIL44_01040 [candidate division WOR-3 bacterium]
MKVYVVKEDFLDQDYGYEGKILEYFSTIEKAEAYLEKLFLDYCEEHPEYPEEEREIYYETDFRHYIEETDVK